MNSLLEQVNSYMYEYDLENAYEVPKDDIKLIATREENNVKMNLFEVGDEYDESSIVKIVTVDNKIISFGCTCRRFKSLHTCEDIPAVLINCENDIVTIDDKYLKNLSKNIFSLFSNNKTSNIKKELNVEYTMEFSKNYRHAELELKIRLGTKKLYNLGNKLYNFTRIYDNEDGTLYFGKEFEYDPKIHYFNDEDTKILDYIFNYSDQAYMTFYNSDISKVLKLFSNRQFIVSGIGLIDGIIEGLPFDISLNKEDNDFALKFNYDKDIKDVSGDYRYIIYDNKMYHLDSKYASILKTLVESRINTLLFDKKELDNFSKSLLPIIKNDLIIDNNIEEISVLNVSKVKLYFDLNQDNINCKIKLNYNKKEIDYFEDNKDIVRDTEFEKEIIDDLMNYGFQVVNKRILLLDLDSIVYFIENGLDELSLKYQVYTSEKFKNTSIIKRTNVSSNFSIGSDNIMHYDFKIQDIDNNEIDNLINSLRKKKKYYRLKNGNIVSLEDDSLNQLNELVTDLNIDPKNSSGEIPKYQAIYLDYLKKEKYPDLKTNNLFEEFIDNFKKYQNVNLKLSNKILRDYQKEGVKWLYTIYKCDLGGILADEMGLGKTIQAIYLMKTLLKEDKKSKFLVVCPTALVYNWVSELDKFGKEIKYKIIHGSNREKNFKKMQANLIITSYGTLREDIDKYEDMHFKVMFIDEAQSIKNPNAMITKSVKKINADTKFALTGTPLENSIIELWSIFDFIMPGFLGSLNKFNEKYHFKDNDSSYNEKLIKLKQVTSPFIMRRKKIDVAKELPDKIENNIYIDLGDKQKVLYMNEVKEVKEEINDILSASDFNRSRTRILQLLTRLRQICIDPRLVYENYNGESNKIENLVQIVEEIISNGHKILIFTSFKSALEIVKDEFTKKGITYYTIDGSVKSKIRKELVDKFNKDETNVFLITIKSGGTGLNLTSADVVIHLDLWWNPQVENQATDRAHRIGQTKNVEVIKLITKGTIEERILELQKKKQKLSDDLIEKGNVNNGNISTLTENDIKKLLDIEK